jgi:hypothetical protein
VSTAAHSRCLDTREKVLARIAEMNASRAAEQTLSPPDAVP